MKAKIKNVKSEKFRKNNIIIEKREVKKSPAEKR